MASEPVIHSIFEPVTGTWQYIAADPATKKAVIIDSVLDFDPAQRTISTKSADALLQLIRDNDYSISMILETHAHADHLTASRYLQAKLAEAQNGVRPTIGIGRRIGQVQARFAERYGIPAAEYSGAFDHLFNDDETFKIGELVGKTIHLPGHTPDHLGYVIGSNVFCGDSLFNHDVGSARCDFPDGSATALYASSRKLLGLPASYKIWTGHDYPPGAGERDTPLAAETVEEQRHLNKHLRDGVKEEEFVKWRAERDETLAEPRLIHYALQVNIRGGRLPAVTAAGDRLLHVPIKLQGAAW